MKKRFLLTACLSILTLSSAALITSCGDGLVEQSEIGVLINNARDILVGQEVQLEALVTGAEVGASWTSSDTSVATVNSLGTVKGLKAGTATITATVATGTGEDIKIVTDSVSITVLPEDANIYHVRFENYDGTLLYETDVEKGVAVEYEGETPTRLSSDLYNYTFSGRNVDPTLGVQEDTVFVAQFAESEIDFSKYSFLLTTGGQYYVAYSGDETNVVLPTSYNYREVVGVAGQGFAGNTTIESVTLGENYIYIGQGAFSGCSNLKEVNLGNSLQLIDTQAFDLCRGLTEVYLPDTVTAIGPGAFRYCSNLETINWPTSLQQIQSSAFQSCSKLVIDEFPETLRLIGDDAFQGALEIAGEIVFPDSLEYLGSSSFSNTKITSANIPALVANEFEISPFFAISTLESINVSPENTLYSSIDGVLFDKTGETLIQIPPKYIGENGVYDVPETVTTLDRYCGSILTELKTVNLPSSVKTVNDYSFYLSNVEHVTFGQDAENVTFGWYVFSNSTLKDFVVPYGVTGISNYMFYDANDLATVTMPDSVQSIGEYGFYGTAITDLKLPDYIQILEYNSFARSNIHEVFIPKSVNIIESGPFNNCANLETVTFEEGIDLIEWSGSMFDDCVNLKTVNGPIPVPSEEDDGYIQLPFSTFRKSQITNIEIPEGIEKIGNWCFDGSSLEEITLPKSLKYIGKGVFRDVENLQINYRGSEEEWKAITIELESGNEIAAETWNITYNYQGVTE